jgi:hypothetical protein
MHLNELSLMGKEAAAGGAAMAGPIISTGMIAQNFRMPKAIDRIAIILLLFRQGEFTKLEAALRVQFWGRIAIVIQAPRHAAIRMVFALRSLICLN